MSRSLLLAGALLVMAAIGAAPAQADTASLSFLDGAQRDDPVSGIGRTATARGNVAAPRRLYVKYRRTGGAACTPSASTDSGAVLLGINSAFYGAEQHNGDFNVQRALTWREGSGTFMFCIWLAESSSQSVTPITQNVTFRAPTGTISGTVAPIPAQPEQSATLSVNGSSEAPARVFAKIRPVGGAPCAPTPSSDSGDRVIDGDPVNGSFSLSSSVGRGNPGDYLVCLWLVSDTDGAIIAGPQPVTFRVAAPPPPPPPPCIVPSLTAGTALTDVRSRLTAANCVVGRQLYVASRRYRRGSLIRVRTTPGTRLPNRAPVELLLSSGKPCVVPQLRRNGRPRRVGGIRERLRAAGCTVGTTRYVRSRHGRRGVVIRLVRTSGRRVSAGQRLSPRTTINIRASRGRR